MIEKLYKNGHLPIQSIKAVTKTTCNRCLGHRLYRDQRGINYCLECHDYGEVNEEMTLYRFKREVSCQEPILKMDVSLSKAQIKGSSFLVNCLRQKQSGCLQAVCGAGKTEMTFELIYEALKLKQKIAIIIPRVEVIKEVYHRYLKAFPKTDMATLYEGKKRDNKAQMIISTPQQMLIFYREFDLMIIDEVDAFPYADNPFLQRLTSKALSKQGIAIYMSATMPNAPQYKGLAQCIIPSRYHYQPLVVPTFIHTKSKKHMDRQLFSRLLEKHEKKRQVLIFVPSKYLGQQLYEKLKSTFACRFVHSTAIDKQSVIKAFRFKEIQFLVTTTLLERGVTFVDIDVYVIDADHKVYNQSTLIQIAGRVGRHHQHSQGELLFFSNFQSKAMKQAKSNIIYMNTKNTYHAMHTV